MDQMKRLKDKKGMKKMHPIERNAKMDVIGHMRDMADDAMGNKLKGLNKVTVASDSPQGLRHGLNKANSLMSQSSDPDQDASQDAEQMMAMGGEAESENPMDHMPAAFDDTHPDHENFLASHNGQDGDDGMDAYPDADGDHLLEMDEEAKHAQDEDEEKGEMYADGGEVGAEDDRKPMQSEYNSDMPSYDDMDAGEMSAHLNELVAALRKKGLV
jgi:hypothetical protein